MSAAQMYDRLERASVANRPPRPDNMPQAAGNPQIPGSSAWVAQQTGASFRQVDYWVRHGLLGSRLQGLGSGAKRRYQPDDVEVIHALVALAALGCRDEWLAGAARAVRAARVNPAGERLIVELNGNAYRHPIDQPTNVPGPAWIVSLSPAEVPTDCTAKPSAGGTTKGAA